MTEKIGELVFYERVMKIIARWSHLLELYKLEAESFVKILKSTEVLVDQKTIEVTKFRDLFKISILWGDLHCFINHRGMRNVNGREHTVAFMKIVVNWWKILNVKSIGGRWLV